MRILTVETSGLLCGSSIWADGRIVCELSFAGKKVHSTNVMNLVEQALALAGCSVQDIDVFAAVGGPGSYTGIRIGMSVVKALGQTENKPCVCVDALEAMAAEIPAFDGLICPVIDAKADHVFTARFRSGMPPVRLTEDTSVRTDDLIRSLQACGERVLLVGEDLSPFRARFEDGLGAQVLFAAPQRTFPTPGTICELAARYAEAGRGMDAADLKPSYLKRPQIG